jgi:enoyl-CoA hydratase/carnithine racemase
MSESTVDVAPLDGVTVLTMRNPGKKNAFDRHMLDLLYEAIVAAGSDPATRVLVLTGADDAFCAGGDVSGMGSDRDATEHLDHLIHHIHRVPLALMSSPKPTIAMINGPAIGAGLDIALACDLRVAAHSAVLREAYVRVGLAAGDGGAWLLPRIVGRGAALDLLLTARPVSGEEAWRMGLVTESVPDEELRTRTLAIAGRLAAQPPNALAAMKSLVGDCAHTDFPTGLRLSAQAVAILQSSREHLQTLRALRPRHEPEESEGKA